MQAKIFFKKKSKEVPNKCKGEECWQLGSAFMD